MLQYDLSLELQRSLNHFSALTGVRIAFSSTEGKEFMAGEARRSLCDYCALLRRSGGMENTCVRLDRKKQEEVLRKRELITYECHGGLQETIMPVIQAGRPIGFIMMGQYRVERDTPPPPPHSCTQTLARQLQTAYRRLPLFPQAQHIHLLGLFSDIVQGISARSLIQVRGGDPVEVILGYLEENLHRSVSLEEAAALACRSPSTISHRFTASLGRSFQQVQIERKLDFAALILSRDPTCTIRQAAARVGYDDPLYFSRLFKRHRGYPPSRIRRKHVQSP